MLSAVPGLELDSEGLVMPTSIGCGRELEVGGRLSKEGFGCLN